MRQRRGNGDDRFGVSTVMNAVAAVRGNTFLNVNSAKGSSSDIFDLYVVSTDSSVDLAPV